MDTKAIVGAAVAALSQDPYTFLYLDEKTGKKKRRVVQFIRPAKEMKEVYESKGKGSWTTDAKTEASGAIIVKNDKEYLRAYPCAEDASGYSDVGKVFSLDKVEKLEKLTIKETAGDLIAMGKASDFDLIIQGCNCFNTMGSGLAAQIRKEFPDACRADKETRSGDKAKLGDFTYSVECDGKLLVVNGYTQYGFGRMSTNPEGGPVMEIPCDYDAIRSVLEKVKKTFPDKRIGIPQIGAGLAQGDWVIIKEIIIDVLNGTDTTIVYYKP